MFTLADELPVQRRDSTFAVSKNTSTSRKKSSSQLGPDGKIKLPSRSSYTRLLETMLAANEIYGGSIEDRGPALDGKFCTILKYGKLTDLSKYISSSKRLRKAALLKIKNDVKVYEQGEENFIRSLALLYAGGIIGKRKYEQAKSALVTKNTGKLTKKGFLSRQRIKFSFGIPVPKPLAYSDLMEKINTLDIGELISVKDTLCANLPQDKKVCGVYRDLEKLLLKLSEFYFETDQFRKEKLTWFGEREGAFKVAIGGDRTPFGKWEESVSWLVSFLIVGSRVASPNENFLLFGANCKEDHDAVVLYIEQLCKEMEEIEKKCYQVAGKQVSFTFELVPSDMKFLAFINGELNNAAKYVLSFANVTKDNMKSLDAEFGTFPICKWKPWQYEKRLMLVRLLPLRKR